MTKPMRIGAVQRLLAVMVLALLGVAVMATYHYAVDSRWTHAAIIGVAFPLLAIYDSWRLYRLGPEAGAIGVRLLAALAFTLLSTFSTGNW
jgi:hypothetical protein